MHTPNQDAASVPGPDGLYAVAFGTLGLAVPARVVTAPDGRFATILGTSDVIPEGEWRTGRWSLVQASKPAAQLVAHPVGEVVQR